ncbi:GNAT family N-acetyltransferase [Amycolatopsis benzoatilytica]|uniref:GNAT family N-acetyltransferase n=1 Tax=Amycolatopsis benzoatilytica TaxID=346045 RepID=UPI00036220B2|nr:GNAT family N-acetyltransferase [Amycolatopsis benzoatilytica]
MEIRQTTSEDYDLYFSTVTSAFGQFFPTAAGSGLMAAFEPDRGLFALGPDGRPIGCSSSYSFELTLPGDAAVPAGALTGVGVLPTHRRQGVLSAMMRRQLQNCRDRDEFLSVLLASEAVIYRRFGYGPATYLHRLTVDRSAAAFAVPQTRGTIEMRTRETSTDLLAEIYDRYRRTQPGAVTRPRRWWELGAGQPPVAPEPRHVAVHRDPDGVADGYATYLVAGDTLTVDETIGGDEAAAALARFLLTHDLVKTVVFRKVPQDSPLRWQLRDFRAAEPAGETDWLWVRLLDVPRALTARGWFADGELVLDVADGFADQTGRYLLTVRDGKAECARTDREADLSLDVSDLGSVYLGGTPVSTLVRAGRVQAHRDGAAEDADALFRGERAPHCLHWF